MRTGKLYLYIWTRSILLSGFLCGFPWLNRNFKGMRAKPKATAAAKIELPIAPVTLNPRKTKRIPDMSLTEMDRMPLIAQAVNFCSPWSVPKATGHKKAAIRAIAVTITCPKFIRSYRRREFLYNQDTDNNHRIITE